MRKNNNRDPNMVGRNDPCPCDSGKKFKRCHGRSYQSSFIPPNASILQKIAEHEAYDLRRRDQQGNAKPIISNIFGDHRLVAVKDRFYYSKKWKTFHDFLFQYLVDVLLIKVAKDDLTRPRSDQHPVTTWYQDCCEYKNAQIKIPGEIAESKMIGVVGQYMWLAYSIYLMTHNEKLQQEMIKRLVNHDLFWGANYEARVLSSFILAGFEIELEDESDVRNSHVEFVAIHPVTKKRFSVEAKARLPNKEHSSVNIQLQKALKKNSIYPRIVFIDLNLPQNHSEATWPNEIASELKEQETKMTVFGKPAPPAYVIISNHIHNTSLNEETSSGYLPVGFKIDDFAKLGLTTLIARLASREKHKEVFDLLESLKRFSKIPATFDGEVEDVSFGRVKKRYLIGSYYELPLNENKGKVNCRLKDATVTEHDGGVYLVFETSGGDLIFRDQLTDHELNAYRQHPDTFFGVIQKKSREINTPLEIYDFLYETYKNSPKETLLQFMKDSPKLKDFEMLERETLVNLYCQHMAAKMFNAKNTSHTSSNTD
ncbi:MAG: SEC-C domain-containing protein [Gammaproteobacteria bacterium]|nr:MAG: SEC-C domain-containing protein [Gammaproteobacteria bacterium]